MVTDLFSDKLETHILTNTLKSFGQKRIERFVTSSVTGGTVSRNGKGGNQQHSLTRIGGGRCFLQNLAILQLFTQPLQNTEWFVDGDRHAYFGQIFANIFGQQTP